MLVGLVGRPNSGKSTFFKASTLSEVDIGNYPFTTIDPNKGTGFVRVECVDKEFEVKCNPRNGSCVKGTRFVPVELIDVAGLVPGASEGKGLGNKCLDDLRKADALIHVIDLSGSTNEKGEPTEESGDDTMSPKFEPEKGPMVETTASLINVSKVIEPTPVKKFPTAFDISDELAIEPKPSSVKVISSDPPDVRECIEPIKSRIGREALPVLTPPVKTKSKSPKDPIYPTIPSTVPSSPSETVISVVPSSRVNTGTASAE